MRADTPFGSIVLTRFPFTDLSGEKQRPALVVSRDNDRRQDLVLCFITSRPWTGSDMTSLDPLLGTGLKVSFTVRFNKIATLSRSVIAGKLGDAPPAWLKQHSGMFFRMFGFRTPAE